VVREGVDTAVDRRQFDLSKVKGITRSEVLTVTPGYSGKGGRTWYSFNSPASTFEYLVHNPSLVNVARGLVERVFCVVGKTGELVRPPKPAPGVYIKKLGKIGRQLSSLVGYCHHWTRDEFVSSYSGPRRASYERAAATLDSEPLTVLDSYLSTFVKAEKINSTLKPDPPPRVIQPRGQRYNIEVGRYLKPLEPRLMKCIDKLWGSKTAIKGYTVEKVGQIMAAKAARFREPVFVGLDASRFDQHCSREALEWEHSIYNEVFGCPRLAEMLTWQLRNRGTAYTSDGKIKYSVEGCRMSGDMNTSMGNYLIMSALCYAFCKEVGLTAELANCGDDCVLFMEKEDLGKLSALPDWFVKMGYTMKVEAPVYHLEQVEFCQMHPVLTSRGWVMVRRPDTVVTKDCCVVRGGMTPSKLGDWLGAQRAGGLSLAGDVPVLSQFYKCFPEKESDCLSDYAAPHKFQASQQCGSITEESRYSFWLAFGITPDEQLALEEELGRFTFTTKVGERRGPSPSLFDYCCR
jgi:hypothetical protein